MSCLWLSFKCKNLQWRVFVFASQIVLELQIFSCGMTHDTRVRVKLGCWSQHVPWLPTGSRLWALRPNYWEFVRVTNEPKWSLLIRKWSSWSKWYPHMITFRQRFTFSLPKQHGLFLLDQVNHLTSTFPSLLSALYSHCTKDSHY